MDSENKDKSNEFGRVIDALHSKQKLPSLRTYQGDMAEFIKSKNESVISIAVKEKEKKQEEEREQNILPVIKKTAVGEGGFKMNLATLFLSILLLGGGVLASLYIFEFIKKEPPAEIVLKTEIIPYNNLITLANLTNKNFGTELSKLVPTNGISILKISDTNGSLFSKSKELFDFWEISLPATLERTIKDEYALGIISQNNQKAYFLVISVNDFGRAFSGMLDWEKNMEKDLSFLEDDPQIASSTIPMKSEVFIWKDIIIKNKDTRGLVNEKNQAQIAYTFLDKNTILIVNNLWAIGDISSAYASRSVVR
ncbi:MAG: hypothetical protein AAB672_00850 [Patescibacteria group bacterium]